MASLIPHWSDGREICEALAKKLRQGVALDSLERDFLARALEAAATGKNIKRALRLTKGRGRPLKSDRNYWIYARVEELALAGMSFDDAYKRVAEECSSLGEFSGRGVEAWEDVKKIHTTWRAEWREANE